MANYRLYITDTDSGERYLLAETLNETEWDLIATAEELQQWIRNRDDHLPRTCMKIEVD